MFNKSHVKPETKEELCNRFWSKANITKPNECWEWLASKKRYGQFRYQGKIHNAQRIAWFLSTGIFPTQHVCHSCDNPGCVNPNHLFLGTHQDNMHDMISKSRNDFIGKSRRGSRNAASKFTEDQVKTIKSEIKNGRSLLSLAKQYDVDWATIKRIKIEHNWSHVK